MSKSYYIGGGANWVNISPKSGSWEYLHYKKINNEVTIMGYATSWTFKTGSGPQIIASLPSGITPKTNHDIYTWMSTGGHVIVRGGLNPVDKTIFLDWGINISDNSYLNNATQWLYFQLHYFID